MASNRRKSCFLFYVYGYCLGLGTGIIATILAWTESGPAVTRALLCAGLGISVATLTLQSVIGCDRFGSKRLVARSVINIIGLSTAAVVTGAGTFFHSDGEGLFFLCGTFSVTLYVMTTIAFIVNLVRSRAHKNTGRTNGNTNNDLGEGSSSQPVSCMEMMSRYLPADPYIGDIFSQAPMAYPAGGADPSVSVLSNNNLNSGLRYPGVNNGSFQNPEGNRELSVTELLLLGIPMGVSLPSYTDISEPNSDLPPQYSDVTGASEPDVTSSQILPSSPDIPDNGDQPPDYDDIIQDSSINMEQLNEETPSQAVEIPSAEGQQISVQDTQL